MIRRILHMIIPVLIMGCFCLLASGQEKTLEQKEKEAKLQQAIEQYRKAMQEQVKILEQQGIELQKAGGQESGKPEGSRPDQRDPSVRNRTSGFGDREGFNNPFFIMPGSDFTGTAYFRGSGEGERTSLEYSKAVRESTISKQFSFEVDNTAKNVVMNIMGDCKSGEIKIKILLPGGKTYSDVIIDESGNLNWRKSFAITEEENKDKTGEWIFKIETSKATGYFRIFIHTY